MAKSNINFELEGMDEIVALLKKLGELPGKYATVSAKEGAQIALAAAKTNAPSPGDKGEGNLSKGIVLKGEKKPYPSKKTYRVQMDPKMNNIFVRMVNGNRYYYPASMEFGFIKKDGSKVPGHHFMQNALTQNNEQIEKAILRRLLADLEKVTK